MIKVVNSQGTQLYVLDVPATPWASCTEAITAIKAGKVIGCPQSMGELSETREVTEYSCMSSDETAKALGSISRGSMEVGLLLNPEDAEGQQALKTAFADNTPVIIGVELSDVGETSGTIRWFSALVSGVSTGIEANAAVTYTVTLEIASEITECAAT